MSAPARPIPDSPFHEGERRIQERLGHGQKMATIGPRVIRDHMPEQHRQFFAEQPLLFMGSADSKGRPWVSVLAGPPGFAHSPDPHLLRVSSLPVGAGSHLGLASGQRVGLLGIDYSNRRRNRLNGHVEALGAEDFSLAVEQSFGNCPKYIQLRSTQLPESSHWQLRPTEPIALALDDSGLRDLIRGADHFYIATHHLTGAGDVRDGVDVSHRGGRPGFVRVDGDGTWVFPDFTGNRFFNTLGNIEANGLAGIALIDFFDGSLITLTGEAQVDWREDAAEVFAGAERLVRFTAQEVWKHPQLLPFSWGFLEQSPFLKETGTWD